MHEGIINAAAGVWLIGLIAVAWFGRTTEKDKAEERERIERMKAAARLRREQRRENGHTPPPVEQKFRREEIRPQPNPETPQFNGCVYCLSNKAMPGLFKIGYTRGSPHKRARDLYKGRNGTGTGVPAPFKVEFYCLCVDPVDSEMILHKKLRIKRFNMNREFFEGPIADIEQAFRNFVPEPYEFKRGR